jgi:hypothetical protein
MAQVTKEVRLTIRLANHNTRYPVIFATGEKFMVGFSNHFNGKPDYKFPTKVSYSGFHCRPMWGNAW